MEEVGLTCQKGQKSVNTWFRTKQRWLDNVQANDTTTTNKKALALKKTLPQ
jgi:DNA phosphorothioation-dependent restriction protein DptG